MVRTYAFNPSTSTNNFTNLFVEDNNHKITNNTTVGIINLPNYKPYSAQLVTLPTPFNPHHRQYEQNLRSSLRISRANSLPLSAGNLSREQWIHQQQPLLRRQSYVEDNSNDNHFNSSQNLSLPNPIPINAVNASASAQNQPWISPYGNNFISPQNNFDSDEQQYLEQQKQLIYSTDDLLVKPTEMSYGVYQQNNNNNQYSQQPPSYGVDYEKYLKAQEKEQRLQYLRDLQQQAQQQKTKRLLTEVDYGGYEFEKELRKDQNNRRNSPRPEELPPWLRGNPQPKNGLRGNPQVGSTSSNNFNPNIRREKSLPVDFSQSSLYGYVQPNNGFGGSSYALGDANNKPYDYKADLERQIQDRQLQKQREKLEDDRLNKIQDQQVWDPWGKGGAGAPIRDKDGKLVADRSRLQQSWNKVLDTNLPHNLSPNNSMNLGNSQLQNGSGLFGNPTTIAPSYSSNYLNSAATYPTYGSSPSMPLSQSLSGGTPLNEKDAYKNELQKQIDERKRQREYEKQLEKQQDERDRIEFEKFAAKQRQELEAEKEKQRAKQEMAQKKFETMQTNDKPQTNGNGPSASMNRGGVKKLPNQNRNQPDDGLEWWERGQQNRPRVESALLPTMKAQNGARPPQSANRSGQNSAAARKPPTPLPVAGSRRQSAAQGSNKPNTSAKSSRPLNMPPTPPPKTSYESSQTLLGQNGNGDDSPPMRTKPIKPRSAAVKNEAILRQLSAMRERLNKEQIRVKSALRRKEYGDDLFSDEDGPTAEYLLKDELSQMDSRTASNILSNRRSSVQPNRTKSIRPSSTYDDLFDHRKNGKPSTTNDDLDDDPPLVKLIKNSRTSASNFARTPATNRQQMKKSATIGANRRPAYSDDESPRISRKPNQQQSRPFAADDDSDPEAVVEDYMSKRTAAAKSQSLGRNHRPLLTDSLY